MGFPSACFLFDDLCNSATAYYQIAVVEDNSLAQGQGPLGLIEEDLHTAVRKDGGRDA